MKKIRTLIVDDESLARDRLRQLLQVEPEMEIVGECADGKTAVETIRQLSPDLMFLDIKMPELDGFGVVEAVTGGQAPVIVFVTAYDKFALRAFEIHAVDYLLKPFDRERFQRALHHAVEQVRRREGNRQIEQQAALIAELTAPRTTGRLSIRCGANLVWLNLDEIDWIGAADNYAEVHTGAKSHLMRITLADLEAQLDPKAFVRISRSIIVSARKVKEIHRQFYGSYEITLLDGTKLALSRRYHDKLKQLGLG